jgi:hypothetical protein
MKKIMIALLVVLTVLVATKVQAVEDKYHFGLFLNGDKELKSGLDLTYHVAWFNFVGTGGTLPYNYLGLDTKISDNFDLEVLGGYGFDTVPGKSGWVVGLAPTFKYDKLSLYNDFEYWNGLNCLFSFHSLTYPIGTARIGLDEANFYYLDSKDAAGRSYRVGPSLRIPYSENATVVLQYFYQFEKDGEDSNIFKMSLNFNF